MLHFLEGEKEVIIGIFQTGEMFAIPPVFDGKKYPSTAIAMRKHKLLMLDRIEFLKLLRESSEFSFAVIGWMSEMLREKTATIQNLATASPPGTPRRFDIAAACQERTWRRPEEDTAPGNADIARMAGLTDQDDHSRYSKAC